jgi:hypothetical protein
MNNKQPKPVFSTDNFCLAVSLKAKGCKLQHISKDNPRHAIFHFEDTPERERLTQDFWDGKTLIEPRLYNTTQKELKTLLYDNSYPTKIT